MDSDRIADALRFATRAHAGQVRKGTEIPYIAHPMMVAALVIEYGGDEEQVVAALLHDVVEDSGVSEAELRARFGPVAARIVLGCTDGVPDASGRKPDWRPRKERYLAHLREADDLTALVSCCDKLANARSVLQDWRVIGDRVWDRFSGRKEGSLWYYAAIADLFDARRTPPHRELRRVVDALLAGAEAAPR